MTTQNIERRMVKLIRSTDMWRRGFTIIEVLMVIVILGIAAAVVVPMASSAGSMQIRAAANMIAADMEYAKSMAISRGQSYSVEFFTATDSYRVLDPNDALIAHPVKKGSNYEVNFKTDGRLDRVDIYGVNIGGSGKNKVTFDYLGTPYDEDGDELDAVGAITLKSGGATRVVNVEPLTGFISIN